MAQMRQFIFFKPETNKGEFSLYLELFEKSCRGHHRSDILKTNTKNTPMDKASGVAGVSKKLEESIIHKTVNFDRFS